ncbi:hypothetical protein ACFXKR_34800 [Streptomyces violascens]
MSSRTADHRPRKVLALAAGLTALSRSVRRASPLAPTAPDSAALRH